jgi:hypothetical protein
METTKKQQQEETPYGMNDYTRDEIIFKEEIEPRMNKLLKLSKETPNKEGFDDSINHSRVMSAVMDELEEKCREANAMTGRIIRFQHADSYAFYLVTKVMKTRCKVQWIDYMDGWVDDRIGKKGSLDIDIVHGLILRDDQLKKLFS